MIRFLKRHWPILLLTTIALLLRVWGIQFGKPFRYHPDEIKLVAQAGRLLYVDTWNKQVFFAVGVYPPLITFIYAILFGLYSIASILFGTFNSMSEIIDAYHVNPFPYHLIGRWVSAILGTATIPLLYVVGKKLYSEKVGLISALLLTVSYLHVRNSHFATVDVPVTFLALLTFLYTIRIFQNGRLSNYIWVGFYSGLTIAMKYSAGLIILPIIFAHFFTTFNSKSFSFNSLFGFKPLLAAFSAAIAFLITCPLVWLDFVEFKLGIFGTAQFESVGKLGSGGGFWSYLTGAQSPGFGLFADNSFASSLGFFVTVLICIGVVILVVRHKWQDILVLIFPVITFLFFADMSYKAMRHLLPIVPFLLLVVSVIFEMVLYRLKNKKYHLLLVLLSALTLGEPLAASIRSDLWLTLKDPRTEAKEWIEGALPEGSKIGIERFGPPLLSSTDMVLNEKQLSENYKKTFDNFGIVPKMYMPGKEKCTAYNAAQYVKENKIDYIVLDSFTRATFEWPFSRKRYPEITEQRQNFYRWVEANCSLLKRFSPPSGSTIYPKIELYKVASKKL